MPLHQYYSEKVLQYQTEVDVAQKLENRLSFTRLGAFLGAVVLFYITLNFNAGLAITLLIIGLTFFGYVLKQHLSTVRKKEHLTYLLGINKKELSCINGNSYSYPDGKEHMDTNHPYAGDLDIFGRASLFQYLNRTTSKPGSNLLADWLKAPASIDEITARQSAIDELKDLSAWRQELMAIGYKYSDSLNDPEPIIKWINEPPLFLNKKTLKITINGLTILTLGLLAGWFAGLSASFISLIILVNLRILYKSYRDINKIHSSVGKTSELLKSFVETIKLIENQQFKSQKLNDLQNQFTNAKGTASAKINELSILVNKLDYRLNVFVGIPLNLFYFWDIRQVLKLERWKVENQEQISTWFKTMAEFEALSSFANLSFNNPGWIMPTIFPEHFKLITEDLGHPLIPGKKRISNDFKVDQTGKIIIVTGSNMSGKSTFLRTVGINIVLALAGGPVCAKTFTTSRILVLTSMRIIDSLEENTSSFYAELKRLAGIIQIVERNEKAFLLLDEILRGTNSNDRHIGSVALIKQLVKNNAVGIIATHDLALSQLENELPQEIDNYNFDVKIENDELIFDYKIAKGICKSLNASILMKKMGIRVQ